MSLRLNWKCGDYAASGKGDILIWMKSLKDELTVSQAMMESTINYLIVYNTNSLDRLARECCSEAVRVILLMTQYDRMMISALISILQSELADGINEEIDLYLSLLLSFNDLMVDFVEKTVTSNQNGSCCGAVLGSAANFIVAITGGHTGLSDWVAEVKMLPSLVKLSRTFIEALSDLHHCPCYCLGIADGLTKITINTYYHFQSIYFIDLVVYDSAVHDRLQRRANEQIEIYKGMISRISC